MASISNQPIVALDYTPQDLYSMDGDASDLVLVFAYPSSTTQFPSKIFPHQTPLIPQSWRGVLNVQRLHNLPVKFSFTVGNLPVVLPDLDCEKTESAYSTDASEVFGQLHPNQRPDLSFVPSFKNLTLPPDKMIVALSTLDHLVHLPLVIHPDTHYNLLSKQGLAYSGLPTPETLD